MRVVIAGAGSVGRSIARELLHNGHQVLLVDKDADDVQSRRMPEASWLLADACEISALREAGLADCDTVVAATGDDKANLVVSLLAKTEFGVPRTVARVNNPRNEWLFDEAWGVDVAVSTPRLMTALVEEAVSVGDLELPPECVLVAILREDKAIAPTRDDSIEGGDELLFVSTPETEDALEQMLSPGQRPTRGRE
jgi:trk system potassium uptake protein TrkA